MIGSALARRLPLAVTTYVPRPSRSARCINHLLFSNKAADDGIPILESSAASAKWRKQQLGNLERKIKEPSQVIDNDEDLQPMWSELESRVTRRRPRTKEETGQKTGRANVKRTDEEFWLREGVYEDEKETTK